MGWIWRGRSLKSTGDRGSGEKETVGVVCYKAGGKVAPLDWEEKGKR